MTEDLVTALAERMASLDRPGHFCASGGRTCPMPNLEVDGVGPVAFPVLPYQAEQLVAAATPAPYGRGADTLLDEGVRKTWQLDAARVHLTDTTWAATLADIVRDAAAQLGADEVEAELYKLLVYDQGSFFAPHRDTEKVDGMFATLVVCLPSRHEGGELVILHRDQQAHLDLRNADVTRVTWAAFYADCLHEIRPITSGHRVCLVYNLVRRAGSLVAPDHRAQTEQVTALLRAWAASDEDLDMVLYVLDHRYTPAGLSFAGLKNGDGAAAQVLVAAAREADCVVHVGMVSIHEEGSAEPVYHRRRGRYEAAEDFEIIEVNDRHQVVEDWSTPDDRVPDLPPVPWDEDEVCPEGALDDLEPDEVSFTEATGNEGGSFERTYRRAAVVLWPANRRLALIARAGVHAALPMLAELPPDEARQLAARVVATWPERLSAPREGGAARGRLLEALAALGATDLAANFLDRVHGYDGSENAGLVACWDRLDREVLTTPLCLLLARHLDEHAAACAELLERLMPTGGAAARALAVAAVDHLPRMSERRWYRPELSPDTVARLIRVVARVGDVTLVERAATTILAQPTRYPMDGVLVPAVLLLGDRSGALAGAASLHGVAVAHLRARIALPLAAPTDWTRDSTVKCRCASCASFVAFLAHAGQERWALKAAEHDRKHVIGEAAGHDVEFSTVRGGSPHTLVAVKNQRSYERRKAQRADDLYTLAKLDGA